MPTSKCTTSRTRKHRRLLQKKLRSVGLRRRRRDSIRKRSLVKKSINKIMKKSMKSRGGSQYNYTACAAGWLASDQSSNWCTTDDNKVGKELSKKLGLFLLNRAAQQEITYHIPMLGGGERDCMIGMLVVSDALRSAKHMNLQNLVVDIFSEHLVGFDLDGFPEQHCWLVKLCDKLRPRNLSELPSIIDHNSSTFLEDLHTYTGGAHIQIHNCGLYGKDERLGQAMKEIQTTLSNSHTENHQILAGLMVETGADAQLAVTAPIRVDADTDTMSLQLLRQHVTEANTKYPLYYMEWNTAMDTNLWPSDQQPPYLQDITDVHWWPPLCNDWNDFTSRSTEDSLPWKCSECVSQSSSSRYISWYRHTYGSLQKAETGAVVQFEVLADNNIPTSNTTIDASVTSYAQLRPKYLIADIDLEKLTESPHTTHFDKIYSDALLSDTIGPSPNITYSAYLGSLTHYRLTNDSLFATLSSQTSDDTSDGRNFKNRMLQQIRLAVYTYTVALNHLSKTGRQVRWGEPLFDDIPSIDVLTRITKGTQDIYDTYIRSASMDKRMYNASKMVHANFLMQYGATIYDLFWVFATKGMKQSVQDLIARYPCVTERIYPYIFEGIYLINMNMVTEDNFNDPNTFTDIPDPIHGNVVQNSPQKVGWKPTLLSTAAAYYSLAKSVANSVSVN